MVSGKSRSRRSSSNSNTPTSNTPSQIMKMCVYMRRRVKP